jgi:hypothetical protein
VTRKENTKGIARKMEKFKEENEEERKKIKYKS